MGQFDVKPLRMPEISRALARHDPNTVYTLLRESMDTGTAGAALLQLIKTQPDWPKIENVDTQIRYKQALTIRELEVLRDADRGMSTAQIAHEIPLSLWTVKSHKKHIYSKLGVNNMLEALHKGRELGLLN